MPPLPDRSQRQGTILQCLRGNLSKDSGQRCFPQATMAEQVASSRCTGGLVGMHCRELPLP
jgi:hypothetical protein